MTTVAFWAEDPTVLLQRRHLGEWWPTADMCYEQKLNAITRLVLAITLLGFVVTQALKPLVVGALTLLVIFALYTWHKRTAKNKKQDKESFVPMDAAVKGNSLGSNLAADLRNEFQMGTKKNPFSNVLLTEIGDTPDRQAAPPAFNVDVDEGITKNVKRSVQMMNPTIKSTNKQLFGDLWQNFELDQSNRVFYSTPNSRVTNDQGAFATYLYGTMPSGKESTPEGAFARVQDNYRYTLY